VLLLCVAAPSWAQARRGQAPPAAPKPIVEPAVAQCPAVLGSGVTSKRSFCDVLTGRDQSGGIIITIPPHSGDVTLTFDLHNRHTYSEELSKTAAGFRRYTATIGVLTADNTLLTRAIIQNEFRTAADLLDRVSGGAGPGGVKAVAPTGVETIVVTIPATEQTVSILGEKLTVIRADGTDNFTAPARPIAVVSNMTLEYLPAAPARRATPAPRRPAPRPTTPRPTQPR
jgi:hypothetical protein